MVDVRPATPGDLDAIILGNMNLAEESEQVRLDQATLRPGIAALLDGRAPGRYWVAELDGRVVGQLLITYEAEAENVTTDSVVDHILERVEVP